MKIEINKQPVPKFKPVTLNITLESKAEQELLKIALRHYRYKHSTISTNQAMLDEIVAALESA